MIDLQGLGIEVSTEAQLKAQHRLWCAMDISKLQLSIIAMSTVTVTFKSSDKGHQETARVRISCLVRVLQSHRAM